MKFDTTVLSEGGELIIIILQLKDDSCKIIDDDLLAMQTASFTKKLFASVVVDTFFSARRKVDCVVL